MYRFDTTGQMTMLDLDTAERGGAPSKRRPGKPDSELVSIPYFHLDLVSGSVDLFGQRHWELRSPWRKGKRPLNTGAAPRIPIRVPLSGILEANPAQKYYLSKVACIGILRRAFERGKELPQKLERALRIQAGLMRPDGQPTGLEAYHINQRDEGIDLHGVSGALLATTNMQMQTFVTQPDDTVEGFDGYNGDLTGDVAATLGVNCGMSTGRNGVMAFAANQFGQWSPVGGYLATLLFGVMSALRMRLQSFGVATQLTQMLPYLAALIGIKLTGMRMRAPAANGAPYPHPLSAPRMRRKAAAAASTKGPKA